MVLLDQRFPPQLSQVPAEMVREVLTTLLSTLRVLLEERFQPHERPFQAVMVREVRTMSFGSRAFEMVPFVMLFALRFVRFAPFPWNAPENLSETTFMVPFVALI